jgi:hypothetical protein
MLLEVRILSESIGGRDRIFAKIHMVVSGSNPEVSIGAQLYKYVAELPREIWRGLKEARIWCEWFAPLTTYFVTMCISSLT